MSVDPQVHEFRILLVEDDEADIYLFEMALKHAGLNCEVTVIMDGAGALAFLRDLKNHGEGRPDMIVLDLNLPKKSGAEVLVALRQDNDLADIPVAVVTSSSRPEDRTRIETLGVEGYFTKGFHLEDYLKIGTELKQIVLEGAARRRALK